MDARGSGIVLLVAGLAGCGRFGFDALGEACEHGCGDIDAASLDAANGDAGAAIDGGPAYVLVAAADTALNSFAPSLNYGGADSFNVRTSGINTFVGLLRFDATALPAGSVTAAALHLGTTNVALSQGSVALYRVLEPWTEGAQIGGAGTANWDQRQAGQAWTAAGCGAGSREAIELARFEPHATGTRYVIALPASLVQAWLDEPSANHGLALIAEGTGAGDVVGFVSREQGAGGAELHVEL